MANTPLELEGEEPAAPEGDATSAADLDRAFFFPLALDDAGLPAGGVVVLDGVLLVGVVPWGCDALHAATRS